MDFELKLTRNWYSFSVNDNGSRSDFLQRYHWYIDDLCHRIFHVFGYQFILFGATRIVPMCLEISRNWFAVRYFLISIRSSVVYLGSVQVQTRYKSTITCKTLGKINFIFRSHTRYNCCTVICSSTKRSKKRCLRMT